MFHLTYIENRGAAFSLFAQFDSRWIFVVLAIVITAVSYTHLPSGALFLDLPLSAVDVNVHPAKTEVKFSQEKPIFEVVYIACKNALAANDNMPHLEHKEKEAPAKLREDNLTHEQQRFAIPKPVDPKPFVTPSVQPTPVSYTHLRGRDRENLASLSVCTQIIRKR